MLSSTWLLSSQIFLLFLRLRNSWPSIRFYHWDRGNVTNSVVICFPSFCTLTLSYLGTSGSHNRSFECCVYHGQTGVHVGARMGALCEQGEGWEH